MTPELNLAKHEGLNWQTLLIEETETEIKQVIKDSFLDGASVELTKRRVEKVIAEAVTEIEDEDFRKSTEKALKVFANKLYARLKWEMRGYKAITIIAMAALMNSTSNATKYEAVKALKRTVPELKGLDLSAIRENAPNAVTGRYWETAQPLKEFSETYMKRVRSAFESMAAENAQEENGDISLRLKSELRIRQERHIEELSGLLSRGVKLVWISTHGNCSERCEQWQGKLYSLDRSYGEIDGIDYQPLENATDIYTTTRKGKTYKNGCISGFGCRHRLIEYKTGNKPIHVPAEEIEKDRAINNRQRYLERGVRVWRERAVVMRGIDDRYAAFCRAKAVEWNKRYIKYSKENRVAYYPSRTKVFEGADYLAKRWEREIYSRLQRAQRAA